MDSRRLKENDAALAREAIGRIKIRDRGAWPSVESLRAFLAKSYNVLVVAVTNGEPIGFALAYLLDRVDGDRRMALFYEIEVSDGHRRRGVARVMIEALKSICVAEGVVKMWVQTSPSNQAAAALYQSTGGRAAAGEGDIVFVYDFPGSGVGAPRT
ncbi:MAG: N-acetyltransferase family protein [Candidatus Bipolaricaulia bacterium]